jgi:hypothetical protein
VQNGDTSSWSTIGRNLGSSDLHLAAEQACLSDLRAEVHRLCGNEPGQLQSQGELQSVVQSRQATPGVETKYKSFKDNAPSWDELELLREERESDLSCHLEDPETVPLTHTQAFCGISHPWHVRQRAGHPARSLCGSGNQEAPNRLFAAGGAQLVVCSNAGLWCAWLATFPRVARS